MQVFRRVKSYWACRSMVAAGPIAAQAATGSIKAAQEYLTGHGKPVFSISATWKQIILIRMDTPAIGTTQPKCLTCTIHLAAFIFLMMM
ncbi:hypothetical protein D3C77_518420 [compost metagenome]